MSHADHKENSDKESNNLVYLGHVRVGIVVYEHFINTKTDATLLKDENFDNVFIVYSDGYMFKFVDGERVYIGEFRIRDDKWYFITEDIVGNILEIDTETSDLLKGERKIFKNLFESSVI